MVKIDTSKPGQELNNSEGLEMDKKEEKHVSSEKKEEHKEKPKEAKKDVPKIDVVKKIIELHNDGVATSKIGLILRSEFKIYNVKKYTGKTITQILIENNLEHEIPEDLSDLLKKVVILLKHMKINKKDMTSKLGYQRTVSKIRRLAKYYKKVGKLPSDWKYSDEQAAILVK
jgi:small subunit ribosomal protein S15